MLKMNKFTFQIGSRYTGKKTQDVWFERSLEQLQDTFAGAELKPASTTSRRCVTRFGKRPIGVGASLSREPH